MTIAKVEIDMRSVLDGTLKVDGIDISRFVKGFTIEYRVGELPIVKVNILGLPSFEAQSEIQIVLEKLERKEIEITEVEKEY